MVKSYFNFIQKIRNSDNEYTLYNSRTGCLSLLDECHYRQYLDYPDKEISDTEFLNQLQSCGYVVGNYEEEYDQIRFQMYRAKFSSSILSLVIAPTMNCNFACTYCYEKNQLHNCLMSEEIQDAIIAYLEAYSGVIRNLKIEWYGGEPLLATEVINRLNERIQVICTSNNIQCTEQMITNGYLLDQEHIKFLNNNKINKIQVTLDGIASTHDSRRMHKTGRGTYNQIMENLKLCKLYYNGQVDLRVNVDKNNIDEVDKLVEELKSQDIYDFVNLYLGRVTDINETSCNGNCLSCQCFAEENVKFIMKNQGLKQYLQASYPHPIGNNCVADYNLALIIAPNGDLYKCHMEVGQQQQCVGNIFSIDKMDISKMKKTLMWDPTQDEICGSCKYLPVCMGGCAKGRTETKRECNYRKYIMDEYLSDISYIENAQGKEEKDEDSC